LVAEALIATKFFENSDIIPSWIKKKISSKLRFKK
jgi:hypothetical protein